MSAAAVAELVRAATAVDRQAARGGPRFHEALRWMRAARDRVMMEAALDAPRVKLRQAGR